MFTFAAFVLAGGRAGAVARRARAARDVARLGAGGAASRSCGATGAATAATPSTSGSRCCSSAWRRRRRSRRSGWSSCGPARPSGWTATRSPTSARPRGWWRRATGGSSGSTSVRGCGCGAATAPAQTLDTYKSYFPSTDPSLGPVSRFFEGEATTEVGLRAGVRRDLWTAVAPDIGRLLPRIEQGDKVFADATELSEEDRGAFLAAGAARPQPLLHRLAAAGHVPADRVAARDLDLARRADRVRGRCDRALARRRPRAAARDRGGAGARRARARARVAAAWRSCWCSSWWRSPCW